MTVKKMKNGKIEFLRFALCFIIMLYHIGETTIGLDYVITGNLTFFANGYFGVEFFFVVSGYLMASAAFKNQNNSLTLGRETFSFMYKKLMAILPYHILVFTVTYIGVCIINDLTVSESFMKLFDNIPNILLVQKSGLPNSAVLGVEWYISDMLTAMLVLYPICRKYYDKFSKIVAPIIALTVIGYLVKTTGRIGNISEWTGLFSKTLLRAVAEICAGVFVFELCRNLKKLNFSKSDKIILSFVELLSYLGALAFIIFDIPAKYEGHFLIILCVGILLSFSEVTLGNSLFNNKVVYFLGSLSLPLYLCQSLTRRIATVFWGEMRFLHVALIFLIMTFAMVFILMPFEKKLRNAINDKLKKLRTN